MSDKETKAVVVKGKKSKPDTSVDTFISQAIQSQLPIEQMQQLFALKKEVEADNARKAFVAAMANFQSECPVIEKTKIVLNKDGRTVRYKYAPIDAIVEQIKKPLAKNGLAYTWTVKNEPNMITAICKITHELGHSEQSDFQIPVDSEGYMTAPQKVASALTFAKRYSLCNALGISTGEEDTDATDVGKEPNAKSDKSKIIFLLRALGNEPKTKEETMKVVEGYTKLELEEKNYGEIVERLEVLVKEKQEYEKSNI